MALSRVQATPKNGTSSATLPLTFAAPPTVGNGIVVVVATNTTLPTATACTDNYGNTYELVIQRWGASARASSIYFCQTVATTGAGFVVSVGLSTINQGLSGIAIEVGGTGGQLRVDRVISNYAGTSLTGTAGTTAALRTTADAFAVAHLALPAETSITVGVVSPTWTQEYEQLTESIVAIAGEVDTRILTAAGGTTQTVNWTWVGSSVFYSATLAIFAAATAVPPNESRVSQDAIELLALPAPPPLRVSQDAIEVLALPAPPPLRVSQSVVEILSAPSPSPIITQFIAETLSYPTPAARSTQLVVETLSSASLLHPVDARATQLVVETITQLIPPLYAKVTQLIAEVLTKLPPVPPLVTQLLVESVTHIPPSKGRVTQTPLELIGQPLAPTRLTQAPTEVLGQPPGPGRLSQAPLELLEQRAPAFVAAHVSQVALEIIYPFGCYPPPCVTGEFPIAGASASACAQGLGIDDAGTGSVCGPGGGTSPPPLPRIPAGTIMIGGWGDAGHCVFLSPDGATTYPPVAGWPSSLTDVSAFCRLTTGDIALVGGNAPQFPESGSGVLKASDLSTLSQYTGDRPGQFAIAADALGNWYTFRLSGSTGFFTRMNAASAQTGAWDVALGVYADSQVWAMAVSADGLTAYVWLQAGVFGSDPTRFNYHILVCSLAGAGALGAVLTTDYNYQAPSAGSLLVVPGSGDIIAGFRHLNGSSTVSAPSVIRRYTPSGTLVWTATFPAGAADWATWMYLAHGVPGATHFLAYAYDDLDTSSSARYTWFSYATGAPDNTRNFVPDAGSFEFDSQFVVLAVDIF